MPEDLARQRRFEESALTHIDSLYRTALRLTSSREQAEDLVQETYLRAYRAFDRFDGRQCRAWLFTILRHTYISQLRHSGRAPLAFTFDDDLRPDGDALLYAGGSAEEEFIAGILAEDLERALDGLPEASRTVLWLAYVEELSYAEIAQVMDCPLGTVMSRLYRARHLLEQRLMTERTPARTNIR